MKIPSLSRLPGYKRFNFEARYYDSIKEDIKNRTERIKGELKITSAQSHSEFFKIAFSNRVKREKSSDFMQLLLIVILMGPMIKILVTKISLEIFIQHHTYKN